MGCGASKRPPRITAIIAGAELTGVEPSYSEQPSEPHEDEKQALLGTATGPASSSSMSSNFTDSGPPADLPQKPMPPLRIWEHVRDAVQLWGDRGGGVCQPQPLFDVISTLVTLDSQSQKLCGFHAASVHMGSNAKVARALVPLTEGELSDRLSGPGTLSLSARVPRDELGLKTRLEEFLMGNITITDPELKNAIHAQDVDWADVDNGSAVLSLAHCLKQSGAKHTLHAFVSERKFNAEFAPSVIHKDEAGNPIKIEVMTDDKGNAIQGLQFRVSTSEDLSAYEVKPSIIPYVKEMEFEKNIHNDEDARQLISFEIDLLGTQIRRAGLADHTVLGQSGICEAAGLSGNVHKLTYYLYNHDGSVRNPQDYRKDTDEHFSSGIGNPGVRRKSFQDYTSFRNKRNPAPIDFQKFFDYCRKPENKDDKIVVHCGGPLFLVHALAQEADLRERVSLIGAMFLSYDGEANLLGMNFNEGVALELTHKVFGEDGKKIHESFPNARLLCVTTETCKCASLSFVPFLDTLGQGNDEPSRVNSLRAEIPMPESTKNQPLLIISDDGKDPDDELAKILLNSLIRRGLGDCLGFISNLNPAKERARLARGTLDQLGMKDIPVGVGQDMIQSTTGAYEFDAPYLGDIGSCRESGTELFAEILEGLDAGTLVTLVCLSGLADPWLLAKNHRDLFRKKIGRVVIMGGVEVDGEVVKLDADGFMTPDKAQNNTFDMESAQQFYRHVQQESIPLTVVTRWAAYAAKLPFSLYDAMAKTGHPVGVRLHSSQRKSLEHLWKRVQLEQDDTKREGLPGRCDKAWFAKVFLGGKGEDRDGSSDVWDLASTFQAYDPVTLLAALHGVRARFMRPLLVNVEGSRGPAQHEILGMSELSSGVVEGSALGEWLHIAILTGLTPALQD